MPESPTKRKELRPARSRPPKSAAAGGEENDSNGAPESGSPLKKKELRPARARPPKSPAAGGEENNSNGAADSGSPLKKKELRPARARPPKGAGAAPGGGAPGRTRSFQRTADGNTERPQRRGGAPRKTRSFHAMTNRRPTVDKSPTRSFHSSARRRAATEDSPIEASPSGESNGSEPSSPNKLPPSRRGRPPKSSLKLSSGVLICGTLILSITRGALSFSPSWGSSSHCVQSVAPPTHGVVRPTTTSLLSSSSPVSDGARDLYRQTPLIESEPLTKLVGKPVYLKLDALQASGSFKDRGMAHLCHTLKTEKGTTQLISSSGGNAGLAVTTMAALLDDLDVSVIVPETTKPMVVEKLKSLGADVTITGENWNAADAVARQRVADSNGSAEYVSPYDNPLLWTGHATLVDEIIEQLPSKQQLGALVVCVGGGGLLCGALEGLERNKADHVKVVAAETEGASSFGQAWEKGSVVTLDGINSVATSLGALSVTPVVLERSRDYAGTVESSICTDAEAIDACLRLAQDHRILVEPACGAGLAVAYSERLRKKYLSDVDGPIVLEVCGGSGVNVDLLQMWKEQFGID